MADIAAIRLLAFDCDGVLTDGSVLVNDAGEEMKRFHVRDGFAMKAAMSLGYKVAVVTGRASRSVSARMNELGIELYLHRVRDKGAAIDELCKRTGLTPAQAAYVGDDLIDLPAMRKVAYPVAVADAVEEVITAATYVTRARGGRGAAREVIEHVLKAQGKWSELLQRYEA